MRPDDIDVTQASAVIDAIRQRSRPPPPPPIDTTPGSGDNGGMEARISKLEAGVKHLQDDTGEIKSDIKEMRRDVTSIRTTDFRLIFGAIIAVALGLAGLMAHGFKWL